MDIKGNLLYGQSGGPTSVINSSAYGVICEALKHKDRINEVFIAKYGIDGVLNDDLIKIDEVKDKENISLLKQTPGAAFGSTRHKLKEYIEDKETYDKILATFKKHDIRFFLYNGGNDSMDTIYKLSEYFKKSSYKCFFIGIPKTIDNDLVFTDHCPGFGSSSKYIANTISCIIKDASSYSKGRINIVEIMGRDTGWLTCSSILADPKPDLIFIPEIPFDMESFILKVEKIYKEKNMCYVAVSEGIRDKDGKFIADQGVKDAFGHAQLGGVASYLSSKLASLGYKTRGIELSLAQRSATFISSKRDVDEAIKAGSYGVKSLLNGKTDKMVCFKRKSDEPYKITYSLVDLQKVAGQVKYVPSSFMDKEDLVPNDNYINYALPLIEGEAKSTYINGVIKFSSFLK